VTVNVNDRFGYGIVINSSIYVWEGPTTRRTGALLLCDCGTFYEASLNALKLNRIQSCGCFRRESFRQRRTTHGMSYHPYYHLWTNMMARCYDALHLDYHRYGGRGITVCSQWHDVKQFISDIERLLGDKPSPDMSLDRINNDGNYEPDNVQWATAQQQAGNRSAMGNQYYGNVRF